MRMVCKVVTGIFALLCVAALALFVIGSWGLFGAEPSALSGIYLIPLGLPWVTLLDNAPQALLPWIGVLAPFLNLGILILLCRLSGRHAGKAP